MATIQLAMMLRKDKRTAEDVSRVLEIARHLGCEASGSGYATVSARISPERFAEIFRIRPTPVSPQPPSDRDAGAPGGFAVEELLPVPEELRDLVESISVVPPARRL